MRQQTLTLAMTAVALPLALPIWAQNPANPEPGRIYHFTNAPPSLQAYQELATLIRTVANVRNVSINAASAQIEFSGRGESPDAAEWLLRQLDKAPGAPASAGPAPEFDASGSLDGSVRVFTLAHTTSTIGIQEVLTILRTMADVQRVFNYTPLHALAMRGPAAQLAMAEWLIGALDQPTGTAKAMQEFRVPGGSNDIVRVYSLSAAKNPEDIQRILVAVRTTGGILKTFASRTVDAIAVRGTPDQMANADGIIVSMDKQLAR